MRVTQDGLFFIALCTHVREIITYPGPAPEILFNKWVDMFLNRIKVVDMKSHYFKVKMKL